MDARRFVRAAPAILLAACILLAGQLAQAQNVYVEPFTVLIKSSYVVPAGRYQAIPVRLVVAADLVVQAYVEAGIERQFSIRLTDAPNLERLKNRQGFNEFPGRMGQLGNPAKSQIPRYEFSSLQPGQYTLLLDNRTGLLFSQKINVLAYAVPAGPTEGSRAMQATLQKFYDNLKRNYLFEDFKIEMRRCGEINAGSAPDIVLCLEVAHDTIGNRLPGVFNFILLHELGHSLLRLWGEPAWNNEDVADQVATAFLIMGNRSKDGFEAIQWWRKQDTLSAALQRPIQGESHSPSGQRARNIEKWLGEGNEFARMWHGRFIPHVRTEALKAMEANPKPWADMEKVRAELSRR